MENHHTPNSDIVLDDYEVQLLDNDGDVWAEGEVTAIQKFQPQPKFIFKGKLDLKGEPAATFNNEVNKCRFVNQDSIVQIILIGINFSTHPLVRFIISKPPLIIESGKKLKEVKFNLLNFNKEVRDQTFEFDEWEIKLEKLASKDQYEELQKSGGYLITHKGKLTKKNSSLFEIEVARGVTDFLYNFFSFCKAASTPAFLVEGYDSNKKTAWLELGDKQISEWAKYLNWFSDSKIDLDEVANGFYNFCNEDSYENFIREIIYWYINTHNATSEQAIITIHTALELISWIFLTDDIEALSTDGYHKLSAGDCLALVLGYQKIPSDIHAKLTHLESLAKGDGINGPILFSRIRNKIVHPPSKRRDEFTKGQVIFEAKSLGSWYLELFILSKSNYSGEYTNLLNYNGWTGETELLPWAENT